MGNVSETPVYFGMMSSYPYAIDDILACAKFVIKTSGSEKM
jgi:hypothetical protein